MFQESARALDRDLITYDYVDWLSFSQNDIDYPIIHTVNRRIAVPEIIILKYYDKLPMRDVKYSRQTLFQRDRHICAYCGKVFDRNDLTVDHILPRAQGGKTTWDNTVAACFPCNSVKADRTPEQAGMHLKFKPKKPSWFSPLTNIKVNHPCKTWQKFMYKTLVD